MQKYDFTTSRNYGEAVIDDSIRVSIRAMGIHAGKTRQPGHKMPLARSSCGQCPARINVWGMTAERFDRLGAIKAGKSPLNNH